MPFRKLPDEDYGFPVDLSCLSSEHDPPTMIELPPGRYEWTCPMCGKRSIVTVESVTLGEPHD